MHPATPTSTPIKRKTLHDFFTPIPTPSPTPDTPCPTKQIKLQDSPSPSPTTNSHPQLTTTPSSTHALSTTPLAPIPGLTILEHFLTPTEETQLLTHLDTHASWRTDLSRRTIHYGGTYCLMPPRSSSSPSTRALISRTILTAPPIPSALSFLIDRMIQHGLYSHATRPEFCIVNEYTGSQGISAHVENFRFGSPVCGVSLCNGDMMRFRELVRADDGSVRSGRAGRAERTGKVVDVWMPRGSLLVMRGEARRKWQHEIVRGRKRRVDWGGKEWRRVSLTFRTDKKEGSGSG